MKFRKVILLSVCAFLLTFSSDVAAKIFVRRPKDTSVVRVADSLKTERSLQDLWTGRRMSLSVYPVEMNVHGRALKLRSDHNQILPIYTRSGAFYMVVRLSKGTNWVNGLPRGTYFINNKPITIN